MIRNNLVLMSLNSLLWVVGGIGEDTRIDSTLYTIVTQDYNSIPHGMDEIIIQNEPPDSLHKFTSGVSHELTSLGIPARVPF